MMSSFGDSGLPVFQAGQASWHRPHSVQVSGVEQLLPAQVLDVAGTEDVSSETFSMSMSGVV